MCIQGSKLCVSIAYIMYMYISVVHVHARAVHTYTCTCILLHVHYLSEWASWVRAWESSSWSFCFARNSFSKFCCSSTLSNLSRRKVLRATHSSLCYNNYMYTCALSRSSHMYSDIHVHVLCVTFKQMILSVPHTHVHVLSINDMHKKATYM